MRHAEEEAQAEKEEEEEKENRRHRMMSWRWEKRALNAVRTTDRRSSGDDEDAQETLETDPTGTLSAARWDRY